MNKPPSHTSFFGSGWYFVAAVVAGIPLFALFENLIHSMQVQEDEVVAFGATACFLMSIFTGRYLVHIIGWQKTELPIFAMVACLLLLMGTALWFFVHLDFPIGQRIGINIFLFFLPLFVGGVLIGAIAKMVRLVAANRMQEMALEASGSKAELQLLQSQLSPHFLFNTLNNLYGLSLAKNEQLPQMLLKLSALLRYSVYEAGEKTVQLRDEWNYINNYIDLERLRLGERLRLQLDVTDDIEKDWPIAPMLLIVFVENAFKHARDTEKQQLQLSISLQTWGNSILFSVVNPYTAGNTDGAIPNPHSGFGLTTVRKRLDLQYPQGYQLDIRQDADTFQVHLQLKVR